MAQALSGDLAQMKLSDVVKFLVAISANGRVSLQHEGRSGEFFFSKGAMVHASTGRYTGIDAAHDVRTWGGGRFDFIPDETTSERTVEIPPESLIEEIQSRQEEFRRLREAFPSFDVVVRLMPADEGQELRFVPREWNVLIHVDGQMTLSEISRVVDLPAIETARILYALLKTGIVKVERTERRRPAAVPKGQRKPIPEPEVSLARPKLEIEPEQQILSGHEPAEPTSLELPTIDEGKKPDKGDDDDSESFEAMISSLRKR
jgi:hypothetical protein